MLGKMEEMRGEKLCVSDSRRKWSTPFGKFHRISL